MYSSKTLVKLIAERTKCNPLPLCSGHFGEREFACIFMKTEQGISAWSDIEGVAIMINLRGQKSEKFVQ